MTTTTVTTAPGATGPVAVPRTGPKRTVIRTPPLPRLDWQEDAACQRADTALFFGYDHERIRDRERREAGAKRICATCPVRRRCLEHALVVPERFGVWGGMTELERQTEERRRRRSAA